ncbi:arginine--tRNA ligase, chloroplastic/mitochondrial [Tanacetum coccineum]
MSASSSSRAPNLSVEIEDVFNQSLRRSYPRLNEMCHFVHLKGEPFEKYGDDYMCSNVPSIRTKLKAKHRKILSEDIAETIVNNLPKSDMIPKVSIRCGCYLTFKLSREWMDKRVENMLANGIKTWAPTYDLKKAVIRFPESGIGSDTHADDIRAYCIQEMLNSTFTYCDVEVFPDYKLGRDKALKAVEEVGKHFLIEEGKFKKKSGRMDEPPLFVAARTEELVSTGNEIAFKDLADLWLAIYLRKADLIVYLAPLRRQKYIERCFEAARDVQWLNDDRVSYCGYRTSPNEKEKITCLIREFLNYSKFASLVDLGKAAGHETDTAVFELALKYAYLKTHKWAEFSSSIDELFDEKGNTFVYLLHTQALVRSVIENPRRGKPKLMKALVAKEHELASHLVRFTEVLEEACSLILPNKLCEYLYDLCKKFTSCYGEADFQKVDLVVPVHNFGSFAWKCGLLPNWRKQIIEIIIDIFIVRPVETGLLLCKATSVVMEKCFNLLAISPDALDTTLEVTFESPDSKGLQVRGHIFAWYGESVLDELPDAQRMFYHASIFTTDGTRVIPGKKLRLNKSFLAVPAGGDLVLQTVLEDAKSREILVDKQVTYSLKTNKGFERLVMQVLEKKERKKGKAAKGSSSSKSSLAGSFNLTLKWSKVATARKCGLPPNWRKQIIEIIIDIFIVRPVETGLLLCKATSVVMEKCFNLLAISPTCSGRYLYEELFVSLKAPKIVNPFIPWSNSDDGSINDATEKGTLSGVISLKDDKTTGFVDFSSHGMCKPIAICNKSYIPFSNPSAIYEWYFNSPIEIYMNLIVKDDARKDAFELSCGKGALKTSNFRKNYTDRPCVWNRLGRRLFLAVAVGRRTFLKKGSSAAADLL